MEVAGGHIPSEQEKSSIRTCALAVTRVFHRLLMCALLWVHLANAEEINRHDKDEFQKFPH